MVTKKLFRSNSNKILGGVAGGLGEYFNIDPNIFRLIFVIITAFGGSGIIIYLLLWLILPDKKHTEDQSESILKNNIADIKDRLTGFSQEIFSKKKGSGNYTWLGVVVVVFGLIILMGNFNLFSLLKFDKWWPVLLIFLGVVLLSKR